MRLLRGLTESPLKTLAKEFRRSIWKDYLSGSIEWTVRVQEKWEELVWAWP
jgi:hypothetical protein